MTDTPRIYVASLSDYTAGILHGAWIDADQSAEEIQEAVNAMLAESPSGHAEEWAIHDYDNFGGIELSEYESFEKVSELGQLISEHGPAFAAYADLVGVDYATSEGFEEAFAGEWDSEQDFAYSLADDVGLFDTRNYGGADISTLESYFDWEKWTRDLFMGDYSSVTSPSYSVYVFRSY